ATADWPHAFACRLSVVLGHAALTATFAIENRGDSAFAFTAALHTYLRVHDLAQVALEGLQGCDYEDSASGGPLHREDQHALAFEGEIDRIYGDVVAPLVLVEGGRRLGIAQTGFADTVVWNPGEELAARIGDLAPGEYRRFVCVEAGQVLQPAVLQPGERWHVGLGGSRTAAASVGLEARRTLAWQPVAGLRPADRAWSAGLAKVLPDGAGRRRREPVRPACSTRLDRERAERHAQVPALAGTGQGQGHVALGHRLGLARLHRAGMGFGRDIGAEQIADVAYRREVAASVADLRLAHAQAAAPGLDAHRHRLAVVATHPAGAGCGLVERRPTRHVEGQ